MRRILLACICVCLSGVVSAQVTSRLGRFQVDKIIGCAPFTVTILNAGLLPGANCTGTTPCVMIYTGGNTCPPAGNAECGINKFSATYTTPGTYKLRVFYQSGGDDDVMITVNENIQPDFEVHRCSNNGVVVKVTDTNYEQYIIDFGDGSPTVARPFSNNIVAQHNYAAAGNYTVAVRGKDSDPNAADNCVPAKTQTVTTLTSIPRPTINTLTALTPTSVRIDLPTTTPPMINYRLEIAFNNATTFQVLSQNVYNLTTINVSNLLLDNNYYCFRLNAFNPCTNTNNYSNTVCSQDFDVSFDNGVNNLVWKTATAGMTGVTISRKDITDNLNVPNYATVPGISLAYPDNDYDCNHQFCYTITVNYAGGGRGTSLEKCGIGKLVTTHPAIDSVLATVATGAALSWEAAPSNINFKEFQILRSANGSAFQMLTTTTNEDIADATYTTEGAFCYRVNYVDQCENFSADGLVACPVRLLGSMDATNVITLNWTKYQGWRPGVTSYAVEKLNKAGTVVGTFAVGLDTFLLDNQPDLANQIVTYRVRVRPTGTPGTVSVISNPLTFTKEVNLRLPTAFTPNGDALNEVFTITGQYVEKMNIRIFDRWGILVYASDKNEPWNGTREGVVMPQSTYVWKAEITDLAGRTFSQEGTVLLLR